MPEQPYGFTRLFVRWRGMLSAYVLALVGNPNDAEDILQNVAVNLMEKFDAFDGRDFGAWARQVARWHVMNHWRSERRYRRALSASTLDLMEEEYRTSGGAFGHWEVRKSALMKCLEDLGGNARRLLDMRFVESLELASIADRLRKTAGAVQMRIARLKERLADCVKTKMAEYEA